MLSAAVIQSHREPLPAAWYHSCVESVQAWASHWNFDYRWLDDSLFDSLPRDIRVKTATQPIVASDLARLYALDSALAQGYDCAVWVDADTFVVDVPGLVLSPEDHAFGREVWVQRTGTTLQVYRKIHNAFMSFKQGNPMLEFYRYAALRMLRRHDGPMAPQFIGPKFLSVLHNIIEFPVLESAAMLSPAVIAGLLGENSAALDCFRRASDCAPAAINLCGSMVDSGELTDADMAAVIEVLKGGAQLLEPT